MMTKDIATADVVIVEWDDLMLLRQQQPDEISIQVVTKMKQVQNAIDQAYGSTNGIGIMAIRGVPNFVSYKDQFLMQAHALATKLTEEYRETHLTDPSSLYNAGWSYGKEQLGHNKPPDTSKGSFYYNPVTDSPGTEEDRQLYPYSYPSNVWPSEDLLPNFQTNARKMGLLLKDVAVEIAKHLDVYVQSQLQHLSPEHKVESIYHHLKDTDKVKARLLYYYPLSSKKNDNNSDATTNDGRMPVALEEIPVTEDSWIGWHNDSGFLTALAGEIYVHHITGDRISNMQDIDPSAGLYVIDRSDTTGSSNDDDSQQPHHQILKVNIPYDCCAVQIGECLQIITGGTLCATPHCVRGCTTGSSEHNHIARISLPCFIDTHPSFPLLPPIGVSRQQVLNADRFSHNKVPPLALRWKCDDHDETSTTKPMTFGEFLQETFQMYYGWGSVDADDRKG